MQKLCPNECGTELKKLNDDTFHCEKCDLTFNINKGKVTISGEGAGKLKQYEEKLTYLEKAFNDLYKELKGGDYDGFGLPL